eukprot:CAMPEP_0196587996 /NCGR_PEP_ID=MMETSP1081-20130531/59250_1 /TAXON_ID=36882 /ORGANISM="Pyramimonas amylifera, Strain CCMP720" /LENGTH=387 /DNA_ID=CAMNT_0041910353 /DNA_START=18 /DNA_END=1181 /DNA_ORIENTATION=+
MNSCPNRCFGPSTTVASALEKLTAVNLLEPRIVVVHVAYTGICGFPEELKKYGKLAEQGISWGWRRPYLIARAMTEEDRIDEHAVRRCNLQFDEVWVPSFFTKRAFETSGVDPHKVYRIPETIDLDEFSRAAVKAPKVLFPESPSVEFVFLSVFKWEERKNWKVLLAAFSNVFRDVESVGLYIKTSKYGGSEPMDQARRFLLQHLTNQANNGKFWGALTHINNSNAPNDDDGLDDRARPLGRAGVLSRIRIDTSSLPSSQMPSLFAGADAFVLPSHGEGWGLPLMEAMAMELPTIGTDYGGSTDFMTVNNSYPLRVANFGQGFTVGKWANPSRAHLKEILRSVWEKRADGNNEKVSRARSDLVNEYAGLAGVQDALNRFKHILKEVA